ncbi:MAG TPA: DUF4097 family beta strand repeat-containing protein [Prolixibacteraceae bacterium]|nr:DUF4097 family beta strand repeat-containing protein [Prolixibacteraceae bacterium]
MKQLLLLLPFLLGVTLAGHSQKLIQKNLDVQGKKVAMKFSFADSIIIEAWDQNTIDLKVSADIDNNKYNDYYTLKERNEAGTLYLDEDIDFKSLEKKLGKHMNIDMNIIYRLRVPANLEFDLNTISGQVEVKGALGKMDINSISGFIDYSIPATLKAKIDLSTISGNVYSDVQFEDKAEKDMTPVGTKRKLTLNGGNVPIALKTISGDIYLRKGR